MQAADGGVYHKVTVKEFSQTIMPDEEGEVFLSPVSSTATGDFLSFSGHHIACTVIGRKLFVH